MGPGAERELPPPASRRVRIPFFLGCIACLLGGCAPSSPVVPNVARTVGSASWQELRAERFTLLTDGSTVALEAFAADLARFIAVVDEVANPASPNAPARFFLLSREIQNSFLEPHQLGVTFIDLSGFHGFVRAGEHSPIHRHTLLHEFTHYLTLRNSSLPYPFWYVEGFAEFLGSTRRRDDTMELGSAPPGRIEELEWVRARKEKFEIESILAYEPASGVEQPILQYASSWALVHYLNTSPERKAQLSSFLRLQLVGLPWKEAFAATFPESPAALAEKIDQHTHRIAQGAPDALLFLDLERLNVDTKWTIRKVARPEADVLLGDFSMIIESHAFAEALYRDAIEADPNDLRAQAALIDVLAARGRFEPARAAMARLDVDALTDSESLGHLASAFYREAESTAPSAAETSTSEQDALFAKALALFDRATQRNPRSPVAWAGLGRSRLALGDAKGAIDAFERASKTGERDFDLMLAWGVAEATIGRSAEARVRWNVVRRQGSQAQRERAARLIAELPAAEGAQQTESPPR